MDTGSRNPDRANPLRALPQAVARGSLQVLQQAVRHGGEQLRLPPAQGERGAGGEDGRSIGLDEPCRFCGEQLPAKGRSDRLYCSAACRVGHDRQLAANALLEARSGRHCAQCGAPLSVESKISRIYCSSTCAEQKKTADRRSLRRMINAQIPCVVCSQPMPPNKLLTAKYCSQVCISRAAEHRRRQRVKLKACDHCATLFSPDKPTRRYCCHGCSVEAVRKHPKRTCEQCGSFYVSRSPTARYCSASCCAKGRWAAGDLKHVPRKLNARLFDRMMWKQRAKRPYLMRLTADRLDRLLAKVLRPA